MSEVLTLVFDLNGLAPFDALAAITRVFTKHRISLSDTRLYGEPIEFPRLATIFSGTSRQSFLVNADGFELHLGSVKHYQFNSLSIKSELPIRISWDEWVVELLNEHFVSGWVADSKYEFWQNAEDPSQFRAHGRAWEHLKKKSNGLPPPLEQTIVDTSQNPGRRILRIGFIEAVGSLMWLSERFWELTGAEKERVISAPFLRCNAVATGILRIKSSEECFSTDQGPTGDLQRELRALLYPP
jgi:hypothetical protein